jgi:ribosomal biogenesis protein LAS1
MSRDFQAPPKQLSAWKAVTSLPHALECTLALLVVIQQDRRQENTASGFSLNHLSLRHSYASTIIRLVNGLVDPLQLGAYARSIASIASQLGLPAWLVELRHAATHEDLPSLEILREAARQVSAISSLVDLLQIEKLSRWHGFFTIISSRQ